MKNEDSSLSTTSLDLKSIENIDMKPLFEFIPEAKSELELLTNEQSRDLLVIAEKHPVNGLYMSGIVNEVLNLILRLEYQRQRAESMLINERFVLDKLKSNIESMALLKARSLPVKVQAEHDACVNDITELNWHISFSQKTERKLLKRCEIAERCVHH